jgi:hypothetical protein
MPLKKKELEGAEKFPLQVVFQKDLISCFMIRK